MRSNHYAWIILAVCFFGLLAVQGVRLSFGAFVQPWETQFQVDRGTVSLIPSVSFLVYVATQPIAGKLSDRFRVRLVFSWSALLVGAA